MTGQPIPQPTATVEAPPVRTAHKVDFDYRAILDALGGPAEVVKLLHQHASPRYRLKSVRAWYYRDSIPSDDLAKLAAIMTAEGKGSIHEYLKTHA